MALNSLSEPRLRIALLIGADQFGLCKHVSFDGAFDVAP